MEEYVELETVSISSICFNIRFKYSKLLNLIIHSYIIFTYIHCYIFSVKFRLI